MTRMILSQYWFCTDYFKNHQLANNEWRFWGGGVTPILKRHKKLDLGKLCEFSIKSCKLRKVEDNWKRWFWWISSEFGNSGECDDSGDSVESGDSLELVTQWSPSGHHHLKIINIYWHQCLKSTYWHKCSCHGRNDWQRMMELWR